MFDWMDFKEVARDLRDKGSHGSYRSAVSRAYYVVFHEAIRAAGKRGFKPTRLGEDHSGVWRFFRTRNSIQAKQLANLGWDLLEYRRTCDYDPAPDIERKYCDMALEMAESALSLITHPRL